MTRIDETQARRVYEGEHCWSEEFQAVVLVVDVIDRLDSEPADAPIAVDVELPDGRVETTALRTIREQVVEGAELTIDADAVEARQLLDVLEAGIRTYEAAEGDGAGFARDLRQAIRQQHNRIDNTLTTRQRR